MRTNVAGFGQTEEEGRSSFPEGICPLCSQVFALEQLREHIAAESAKERARTIQLIQAYHSSWIEEHGACEPCWKSYRDAGRMLCRMRGQYVPLKERATTP